MHVRSTMLKKLFGLFGKSESMENTLVLYAPCDGALLKLKDLPDEAFSSEMLGKGFAVEPTSDIIKSPIKANIVSVFPTKHALTLQANNLQEMIFSPACINVAMLPANMSEAIKMPIKKNR